MFHRSTMFGPPAMVRTPGMFTGEPAEATGVESACCLGFDGGDYASVANADYPSGLTQMTVACWFYANSWTSPNVDPIVLEKDGNSGWYWQYYAGSLNLYVGSVNKGNVGVPATGQWHHLAFTWDGATVTTYLNGVLSTSNSLASIPRSTYPFYIAGSLYGSSYYFNGRHDDVRIYSRALTTTEIAALHSNTSPPTSGLVVYIPLEEGTGTTTAIKDGTGATIGTATINGATWHPQTPPKLVSGREVSTHSGSFDGVNDYVDATATSGAVIGVSCWVKANSIGSVLCPVSGDQTGGWPTHSWMFLIDNSAGSTTSVSFRVNDTAAQASTATTEIAAAKWYHLFGSYDGANIKIWVDGVLKKTTAYSTAIQASDFLRIGNGDFAMNGLVDQLLIFDSVPSDSDIAKLARGQDPTASPVRKYAMDSSWVDAAGGNNGTAYNGPTFSTDVPPWLSA